MPDQLSLYNNALLLCGSESLKDLTENREPRRKLDQVWENGEFLKRCLEQGEWSFAMRTISIEREPSITPDFGYHNAFLKPEDWVRTAGISDDGDFTDPLNEFADEAGYWWANCDPLFARLVSSSVDYGLDYSKWTGTYTNFAEHALAVRVFKRLSQATTDFDELKKDLKRALDDALAKDAINKPTTRAPMGSWARARFGMAGRRRR